jgi:NADPH:quinone reductase-like Zn-dependent oxidoreductase
VNHANLNALVHLLETNDVKVIIDRTYSLDQTAGAVAHVLNHHAAGKVAIVV